MALLLVLLSLVLKVCGGPRLVRYPEVTKEGEVQKWWSPPGSGVGRRPSLCDGSSLPSLVHDS